MNEQGFFPEISVLHCLQTTTVVQIKFPALLLIHLFGFIAFISFIPSVGLIVILLLLFSPVFP